MSLDRVTPSSFNRSSVQMLEPFGVISGNTKDFSAVHKNALSGTCQCWVPSCFDLRIHIVHPLSPEVHFLFAHHLLTKPDIHIIVKSSKWYIVKIVWMTISSFYRSISVRSCRVSSVQVSKKKCFRKQQLCFSQWFHNGREYKVMSEVLEVTLMPLEIRASGPPTW